MRVPAPAAAARRLDRRARGTIARPPPAPLASSTSSCALDGAFRCATHPCRASAYSTFARAAPPEQHGPRRRPSPARGRSSPLVLGSDQTIATGQSARAAHAGCRSNRLLPAPFGPEDDGPLCSADSSSVDRPQQPPRPLAEIGRRRLGAHGQERFIRGAHVRGALGFAQRRRLQCTLTALMSNAESTSNTMPSARANGKIALARLERDRSRHHARDVGDVASPTMITAPTSASARPNPASTVDEQMCAGCPTAVSGSARTRVAPSDRELLRRARSTGIFEHLARQAPRRSA